MAEPLIQIQTTITPQTQEALTLMTAEAGFKDLEQYLQFRINADLRDWRYHLEGTGGLPTCEDKEGRPAPSDVFQAFPEEKQCPDCKQTLLQTQEPQSE